MSQPSVQISRIENGRVGFKARDVADLLTLYGVTGGQTRAQLLELARRASTPGWWTAHSDILPGWFEAYLGLEAAASVTWSGRTSRAGWDSATRDVNRPGRPCVP